MVEKSLPSVFKRVDGAPERLGLTPAPGDETCSATAPYNGYSRNFCRCDLKTKDVYTPEVHAELQKLASSFSEFDVQRLRLNTSESPYLGLGFCGRHSPERILRNNITNRKATAERYARQKAARKTKRTEEDALRLRVESVLGRPLGDYAISLDKYESSVLIGKKAFEELLTKLEERA